MKVCNKKAADVPVDAVYIGRPSTWGNPFVIGKDGDRAEVIKKYRHWLSYNPVMVKKAQEQLKGKSLVCFCAPLACHGDVLMEVANFEGKW